MRYTDVLIQDRGEEAGKLRRYVEDQSTLLEIEKEKFERNIKQFGAYVNQMEDESTCITNERNKLKQEKKAMQQMKESLQLALSEKNKELSNIEQLLASSYEDKEFLVDLQMTTRGEQGPQGKLNAHDDPDKIMKYLSKTDFNAMMSDLE